MQEATIWGKLKSLDFIVLGCVLFLTSVSVLTLYAIRDEFIDKTMFLTQAAAAFLGLIAVVIFIQIDYQVVCDKLTVPLFIVSLLALVATLAFGSEGDYGSKSWIKIPGLPDIQPSEYVKLFLIITFSKHLSRVKDKINHPLTLLQLGLHGGIFVGLVLLQGDLGTALVYVAMLALMLFTAGLSFWYFLGVAAACVLAFPYIWPHLAEYQQLRILCGFDPTIDPKYGFQALQASSAIGSGGLFGKGLFSGKRYQSVPMENSDSILAVIGEKFGFVGCMLLFVAYLILICRLLWIARNARKTYGGYICVGIAGVMIAQFAENVGMNLAMLPVVGITLPFLSYGGSSMLSLYLMIGVVESIYVHRQKYFFEREAPE